MVTALLWRQVVLWPVPRRAHQRTKVKLGGHVTRCSAEADGNATAGVRHKQEADRIQRLTLLFLEGYILENTAFHTHHAFGYNDGGRWRRSAAHATDTKLLPTRVNPSAAHVHGPHL